MKTQGESDRDLRERLRDLRVDPPDGGFAASLHRRLGAAGAPEEPGFFRRFWPLLAGSRIFWPAFGAAAGLAMFLAVGHRGEPQLPSTAVAATVPSTKVAVVRINLSAEVAVESAHIQVTLPEGLVFWAGGQELPQRSFEWTQPLRAGDNDIPIAVRGTRPGRYRMTLSARIGNQRVEDEVVLEVIDG